MKSITHTSLVLGLSAILTGCAGGPNARTGTLVGAAGGALAGAAITGDTGGAVVGGVTGAVIGNAVGDSQDRRNYNRRYYRY